MYKFLVLAVLAFGCNALPNQLASGQTGYSSSSYQSNSYGSGGAAGLLAQPQAVSTVSVAQPIALGVQYGGQVASTGASYGSHSGSTYGAQAAVGQNNNWQQYLTVHQGQQFQQVVPAAIQQISRTVEYLETPNQENPIQAQVVEIEPSDNPVHLHFKSRSSTLSASQSHEAAQAGEVQTAQAQDEVQRLYTEVQKPVVQEVKEVITPYRQVTQVIQPVIESLHTQVTRGQGQRQQYNAAAMQQQYSSLYGGQQQQARYGGAQQYSAFGARSQAIPVAVGYSAQVAQVARPVGYQAANYQSNYRAAAPVAASHSTFNVHQPIASRTSYSSSTSSANYKRA